MAGAGILSFLVGLVMFLTYFTSEDSTMIIISLVLIAVGLILTFIAKRQEEKAAHQAIINRKQQQKNKEAQQKLLASKVGLEKIYEMNKLDVASHRESVESLKRLGNMMGNYGNVFKEQESSWALHGGIASGIAGPVAGAVRAGQIAKENEDIRARNQARYQYGASKKLEFEAMANKAAMEGPVLLNRAEIDAMYATIFSWSPLNLFKQIWIKDIKYTADPDTQSITVTANWSTSSSTVCIDGAIRAKIYNNSEKCIGCAYFVLPTKGTSKGSGTFSGVCTDIPHSSSYKIKLEPIDLWELTEKKNARKKAPDKLTLRQHEAIVKELADNYAQEIA